MKIVPAAVIPEGNPHMSLERLGTEGANYWPMHRGRRKPPQSKGQVGYHPAGEMNETLQLGDCRHN